MTLACAMTLRLLCAVVAGCLLAVGTVYLVEGVRAQPRRVVWSSQSDTAALQRCIDRGGVPVVPFGSDEGEGLFACVARVK
jgi:hypothetical protein